MSSDDLRRIVIGGIIPPCRGASMGTTTALRREIESRFIPYVEQKGFTRDDRQAPTFWVFRRAAGDRAQMFSIQWEKYGRPRFRLDAGTCPIGGFTVGLIVPSVFKWKPALTGAAAVVLAIESLVFVWVHLQYREVPPSS